MSLYNRLHNRTVNDKINKKQFLRVKILKPSILVVVPQFNENFVTKAHKLCSKDESGICCLLSNKNAKEIQIVAPIKFDIRRHTAWARILL